ncbi:MAG TPA: molybdopterin molybdotransferase MoeA [Verrucomicrobia bacterium]|nr:molybdopterin molybdotransferase MoeA [Verrucomicrobiota bacterium]HOP97376.1 molybdopterin molybdotransferase MoeA [Verrucomicrobiota bacterium]HPU55286.1 molybdopterin molybdotransferase MoeA [Verrucomicrobiota bacterium]
MLPLEEALQRILAATPEPAAERVPLEQACGRYLLEDARVCVDLPPFDNSSMDGYAVRAADISGATKDRPVPLRVIGRVAAGQAFEGEVQAGTAVRLFTGSALPRGADAVVMQEDTKLDDARPGEVLVLEPVRPWENVRFRGEDIKAGACAVRSGERLTPARIGLLSASGVEAVRAGRRPVVALIATGSELREPGALLGPGCIYESNRAALAPLARAAGADVRIYPVVEDTLEATCDTFATAFQECDAAVTCGGVSVGEMDFVKAAFEQIGGSLDFWKVAIKPGRPFVFGKRGAQVLFGLPGNPVSAWVTFLLLVRPALLRWQGAREVEMPRHAGVLAEPLENRGNRRHFMRVSVNGSGEVRSAGTQASHILSATAAANGLVDVPPETLLAAGTTVPVLRWDLV